MKSTISSIVILPNKCFLSSTTGMASRSYLDMILAISSPLSITFTESTFGIKISLIFFLEEDIIRSFKDSLPINLSMSSTT